MRTLIANIFLPVIMSIGFLLLVIEKVTLLVSWLIARPFRELGAFVQLHWSYGTLWQISKTIETEYARITEEARTNKLTKTVLGQGSDANN